MHLFREDYWKRVLWRNLYAEINNCFLVVVYIVVLYH